MNPPTDINSKILGTCMDWMSKEDSHYSQWLQHGTPSFSQRLQLHVKDQLLSNIVENENIVRLSRPLARKAYTYEKMWAYGNHYCVDIELGP